MRPPTSSRRGADARCAPSRHTNLPEGQRATFKTLRHILEALRGITVIDFAENDHVGRISRLRKPERLNGDPARLRPFKHKPADCLELVLT